MEDRNTKECKMCYQEIDNRAIRCPYCRTWQKKIAFLFYHPATVTILTFIPIFLVYIMLSYTTAKMFNPGQSFEQHQDNLVIKNTKLTYGENDCGPKLLILGEIENTGDISWKEIQLEAIFLDGNGNMIDTDQNNKYSFIVKKHSTTPFKFSFKQDFPEEHYSQYKIKIISARDIKASF